jgi:protein-tyrosine phosphatase
MTGDILFLCSGNYYRSRHAEIYFNWLAAREGAPIAATSRGLALSESNPGPISQHTLARLGELGIESSEIHRNPVWLEEYDLITARLVVALKTAEHHPMMTARFPAWASRIEYWDIHDLDCADAATALPQLEAAVSCLFRRLTGMAA